MGGARYRNRVEADDGWREEAACRGKPNDDFYATPENPPANGGFRKRNAAELAALTVCVNCPVRVACLQFALDTVEDYGIWGGTVPSERKAMRRRKTRGRAS